MNLRVPRQSFQSESGLHQNWMRDYDPTTGRYLQADPLGLVDGASVYGYVGSNPMRYTDIMGLRQGDRGDFDNRRHARGGGDPFLNGIGSYFRGLYRCTKYCSVDSLQTQGEVVEEYRENENFRQCVNLAVMDYLSGSDNRQHMAGRIGTGAVVSSILLRGGTAGAVAGPAMSAIAAEGDASYAIAQGRSASEAISAFVTGDPTAISEELICECIERYGGTK